jgi:hypothetical protein
MRKLSFLLAVVLSACSSESKERAPQQVAQQSAPTEEGKPFLIASDPAARYYLLDLTGPVTSRILVTKRVGLSNMYTTTEYNCVEGKWRQLAAGETTAEMAQYFRSDAEWESISVLQDGSIQSAKKEIACKP